MPFRSDDVKTAESWNAVAKNDIGPSSGHVSSNGHSAFLAGSRHYLRFPFVVLRVKDIVGNAAPFQYVADAL